MKKKLNLCLFDDGAQSATGDTANGDVTAQLDNTESGTNAELGNVQAGKAQNATEQVANDKEAKNQRKSEFEKLIKGDYKDLYDERVNRIIGQRFKETKTLESKINDISPVLDMLSSRYGKNPDDIQGILQAIEGDTKYFEEAAAEKGMTVDAYMEYERMRIEHEKVMRREQAEESDRQAQAQYQKWFDEGESLKEIYPNFDLAEEAQNNEFVTMLSNGISVKHAYEVVHLDDVKSLTAQITAKKVTDNIRARGNRPPEGGSSSNAAFVTKTDVSKLTAKDRREIARRVMAGETITL